MGSPRSMTGAVLALLVASVEVHGFSVKHTLSARGQPAFARGVQTALSPPAL